MCKIFYTIFVDLKNNWNVSFSGFSISTSVFIQDEKHTVQIVEPKLSLKTAGTPRDASYLHCLVSYALNISSEGPLTIVSRLFSV